MDQGEVDGRYMFNSLDARVWHPGQPSMMDCFTAGILSGTPVLLRIQNLRNVPMNVAMGAVSFLGEAEFYTLLVVTILWICDSRLGRLISLLMALCFYFTGVL